MLYTTGENVKLNRMVNSSTSNNRCTNKRCRYVPIIMIGKTITHSLTAKYLGMTLEAKLRWKVHVKKRREELDLKHRSMYWIMGRHSAMSTRNKLVLYEQILKPVWTYGIQLWGCTKPSNITVIQRFQNRVLRNTVGAPWYVRNADLNRDLRLEMVTAEVRRFARNQ
jgi:hypothetical protein